MNKRSLTEQEIRSQYIRSALVSAGWQGQDVRIREEYYFTDGRMNIQCDWPATQLTSTHTAREHLLDAILA